MLTLGERVTFTHVLTRAYESPRKVWRRLAKQGEGVKAE